MLATGGGEEHRPQTTLGEGFREHRTKSGIFVKGSKNKHQSPGCEGKNHTQWGDEFFFKPNYRFRNKGYLEERISMLLVKTLERERIAEAER